MLVSDYTGKCNMTLHNKLKQVLNAKAILSSQAWDWLSYKPSLTKRLRKFTNNKITFHVCHEGFGLSEDQPAWIRKIQWRLDNICWIEADLIIPKSSINPETACLLETHERPIGEQLFQEPSLTRSDFLFYQTDKCSDTWIRESTFHFKQQPLTLKETFFPAFFTAIQTFGQ